MFPITIGTLVSAVDMPGALPKLNKMGFESYGLNMGREIDPVDLVELSKKINDGLEGRPVSNLGVYDNTLTKPDVRDRVIRAIESAHLFNTNTVGVFAGRVIEKSVPESIPLFKEVFTDLTKRAEDFGVRLAVEGCSCGDTWQTGIGSNIGFAPDAWELMFDAVPSDALGLEWEPCHALEMLMDPIAQLNHWIGKVYHVHAKDATVRWDVIREHGISSPIPWVWNRTPGFGDTDWAQIMTILILNGYKGGVDIEGFHDPAFRGELEWSGQARGLKYLKECRGGEAYYDDPLK